MSRARTRATRGLRGIGRQNGLGLLEVLAVLALGALLGAGILALVEREWEGARLRDSARLHAQLVAATERYLLARRDTLAAEVPAGRAVALAPSTLSEAGYLAAEFAPVNGYGQRPCVLLRRTGAGARERVEALVTASGGATPPPADVAEMAASAGPGAGFTQSALPLHAQGAFGAWTLDAAALQPYLGGACPGGQPGPGRLLSLVRQPLGPDDGAPAYLARRGDVADAPWNVMSTPLALGAGATASPGAACGAGAAIALDAGRQLLTCASNGHWKRQSAGRSWKETRPTYADLPATDRPGDVRMVADSARAFGARDDHRWQALAVDQHGRMEVAGEAASGTLAVRGDMRVGDFGAGTGTLRSAADVKVGNDIHARSSVSGHAVRVSGWAIAHANFINLAANPAWPGMSCNLPGQKIDPRTGARSILHPVGSMKHDVNGITMTCQAPWNEFRYMNGRMTP